MGCIIDLVFFMSLSFFRKVGFGIRPEATVPDDPVGWAISQLSKEPDLNWAGIVDTTEDGLDKVSQFVTERASLRIKFKNSGRPVN